MSSSVRGTMNAAPLKMLTMAAIRDALREIRSQRRNSPVGKEKRFRTAEYFLVEAQDYVGGAWDMLIASNVRASAAVSRWVLEAAMNLWWVVSDEDETEKRIADLFGEALRQDANLRDGLAELQPDQAHIHRLRADEDRQAMSGLGCTKKLGSLETRMKDTKAPDRPGCPNLYVLYRICCAASHSNLKAWELFRWVGPTRVSSEPSDRLTSDMAMWTAAFSVLYLVLSAYRLTQTGNHDRLTNWWDTKVSPLLR